jgi:hypothetical protein
MRLCTARGLGADAGYYSKPTGCNPRACGAQSKIRLLRMLIGCVCDTPVLDVTLSE